MTTEWEQFFRSLPKNIDTTWAEIFIALEEIMDPPFPPIIVSWGRKRKVFHRRAGMTVKLLQAQPDHNGVWRYQLYRDVEKTIWGTRKAEAAAKIYAIRHGQVYLGRSKPGMVAWSP